MAIFNGNSPFITLGGVSLATPFVSVQPEHKNKTQDVTAGTGATHQQRASGLDDSTYKLEIGYVVGATVNADLPIFKPGTVEVFEWGPEGNTTGKPRHVQSVIVESVGEKQNVDKEKVVFTLSLQGADAPTTNMYSGGVY